MYRHIIFATTICSVAALTCGLIASIILRRYSPPWPYLFAITVTVFLTLILVSAFLGVLNERLSNSNYVATGFIAVLMVAAVIGSLVVHEFLFYWARYATDFRFLGRETSGVEYSFFLSLNKVKNPIFYICIASIFGLGARFMFFRKRRYLMALTLVMMGACCVIAFSMLQSSTWW
jgi:hypothetical protein